MHFGAGDFAASCQARTVAIGGQSELFAGDLWQVVMQTIVIASRAAGLRPIDCAYGDFSDPDGFILAARRAAAMGFEGKWVIHPNQIELAHEVMTPSESEVAEARKIVAAMQKAAEQGRGAVTMDGKMLDAASIRMAEKVVTKSEMIERKN